MKKILLLILLAFSLLIVSCKNGNGADGDSGLNINTDFELDSGEAFSERDFVTEYDSGTVIKLIGTSAEISGSGASANGSTVTISADGTYIISGNLDGMIIVDTPNSAKPRIILTGASISAESTAAIYVKECDKLFITLDEGSENALNANGEFVAIDENNIDAALFSKQDLTINGSGRLTVNSPNGHGIVSKDDLVLTGGTYEINAASHALDANDSIRVSGAAIGIKSGKDGLHAENSDDTSLGFIYLEKTSTEIECGGDGVSASASIQIESGVYKISSVSSSETDSYKGIKSTGTLLINGGSFALAVNDDAVHSNSSVKINGGEFEISTGDDAFHADESLYIGAGTVNITKSYEGIEGLDIEIAGGNIKIIASDDGINAAGGNDESGFGGFGGGDKFGGGRPGGPGSFGGGPGGASSSNGSITISGGKIYMNASGDGIDANGTLTISGGEITVCGPTSGDTSVLDYDNEAIITGGTFIGTGAQMMAQTFSSSSQGVIALTVGNRASGTKITITDSKGNVLVDYSPALSYQLVVISTPDMKKGESYTVTVGSDTANFNAS